MKEDDVKKSLRSFLDESCSPGAQPVQEVVALVFWREHYWFPRLRATFVRRTNKHGLLVANRHVMEARKNTAQASAELETCDATSQTVFLASMGHAREHRCQLASDLIVAALKRCGYIS
ncbi:MAG: hypothetical protein WC052_01330 [Patescibacteria group bacterium]